MGLACWEQFVLEDNISADFHINDHNSQNDNMASFYDETSVEGIYRPRAIFMDSDKYSIDASMTHRITSTMAKSSFVCPSMPDHMHADRSMPYDGCVEAIRKTAEKSHKIEGFFIHYGAEGQTSNLTSQAVLLHIKDMYKKQSIAVNCVLPSAINKIDIDVCSTALSSWITAISNSDMVFIYQNSAISRNYRQTQCCLNPGIRDINLLIALSQSSTTMSMRMPARTGILSDMASITSNMVPYPSINILSSAVSPMTPAWHTAADLTPGMSINRLSDLGTCEYSTAYKSLHFMSTLIVYRGLEVSRTVLNAAISDFKSKTNFVDWGTAGVRCASHNEIVPLPVYAKMKSSNAGACLISNSSEPRYLIDDIVDRYDAVCTKGTILDADIIDCLDIARDRQQDYCEIVGQINDYQDDFF